MSDNVLTARNLQIPCFLTCSDSKTRHTTIFNVVVPPSRPSSYRSSTPSSVLRGNVLKCFKEDPLFGRPFKRNTFLRAGSLRVQRVPKLVLE